MAKHYGDMYLWDTEASGIRQTELSLNKRDRRIVDEFRSKGLNLLKPWCFRIGLVGSSWRAND
jgi:hypothetical protein